jgi:hypothetical protein
MTVASERTTLQDAYAIRSARSRGAVPRIWLALFGAMVLLGAYSWLIYVPQPDRPHALTVLDRLYNLGIAAGLLLAGAVLGRWALARAGLARDFTRLERLALATGLGLGLLSLATLGLGLLHLYYGAVLGALPLALLWVLRRELPGLGHDLRAIRRELVLPRRRNAARGEVLSVRLLAGISLLVAICTFLRDLVMPNPATGYDTYQYHWAVPLLLLRAHAMIGFPGWAHANLPYVTELLNLIALSLQAPFAAIVVQDAFGVLALALLFALIRRPFGVLAGWLAVAAITTIPLVDAYISESYVETALVFFGVAALVVLVRWLQRLPVGSWPELGWRALRLPALAGICLGFAVGVKYTAIAYIPGLLALLLVGLAGALRRWPLAWRPALADAGRLFGVFGGAAALSFAPWALKNWLVLGNPVYPALAPVFGAPEWDAARNQTLMATFAHFGPTYGLAARFHLQAIGLFTHPVPYGEGLAFSPGMLALGSVLLAPLTWRTLRPPVRRSRRWHERRLVAGALAVLTVGGFAAWTFSGALVERYALPDIVLATALGAALLAGLVGWLRPRTGPAVWAFVLTLAMICVLQATYLDVQTIARSPFPLLTGQVSEHDALRQHAQGGMPLDFWQMVDYVNYRLPHNGKLLMLGRGTGFSFQNRDYVADSGGDWIPYLVAEGRTPQGMLRLLHREGFTYVVYDAQVTGFLMHTYGNHVIASALPAYLDFQSRDLVPVAAYGDISIWRVPAAAPPATGLVPVR